MIKKDHYIDFLKILGDTFVLGGDFNAKHTHWGSRLTTPKGRELLAAIQDMKCEAVSTGKPTYWPTDPNKTPDLIDFFITKNISAGYRKVYESYDMNSDHSPIFLEISEKILFTSNTPTLTNRHTDWESFKLDLENQLNLKAPLKTPEQLNMALENFIQMIQQTAWDNTPNITKRSKGNIYPIRIKELIAEKRKQRRKWHQTRSREDKTKLNKMCKKIKKHIQKFLDESTKNYLQRLSSVRNGEYSLWKAAKGVKMPTTQIPPIKADNGKWAINNEQKAKIFADYLEKIFQANECELDENLVLNNMKLSEIEDNLDIKLVTPREVILEIKYNISPRKAPGYDLISGEILRNLPRKGIVKLTTLINAALRLKHVPELWKVAEVIMIAKPGKPPHKMTSYRPISLLPVMSKLFEKLLLKRLKPIIYERNLIPEHQFGFREKHSTIDQVHRITNVIENALEGNKVRTTVFLDVAQAFDKVWHHGLIYKLHKYLPEPYVEILKSYISNRVFRIRQDDAHSDLKEIKAGVPQGSVLGPVLYLLYTCDIPKLEENTIATFADDTAIMAVANTHTEAAAKVQMAVNHVCQWTKRWRIKLNELKSVHINFTNKKHEYIQIQINNRAIPYENTAKYLGMTLDAKLRWKAHVKKKRGELDLKYKNLYWLLGKHSMLSVDNKLLIYKQVLMPVWTYGIQLWGCTKKSNILMIQRFQNKVLRGIVNAPWYIRNDDLHRDLKVEYVNKVIQQYAEVHQHRLHHHVNVEAIQILDHTDIVRRLKRTKPFELV